MTHSGYQFEALLPNQRSLGSTNVKPPTIQSLCQASQCNLILLSSHPDSFLLEPANPTKPNPTKVSRNERFSYWFLISSGSPLACGGVGRSKLPGHRLHNHQNQSVIKQMKTWCGSQWVSHPTMHNCGTSMIVKQPFRFWHLNHKSLKYSPSVVQENVQEIHFPTLSIWKRIVSPSVASVTASTDDMRARQKAIAPKEGNLLRVFSSASFRMDQDKVLFWAQGSGTTAIV